MLIDGEWSAHEDGYALKLGTIFLGQIRQRGGDTIYAGCWIVSLNKQQVQEVGPDPDYAKGLVERLICDELQRIVPAYRKIKARVPPRECFWGQDHGSYWKIKARVPPRECFWGQDHGSYWKNWKEDRAVESWTFVAATPRQIRAALKRKE